MAIGPERMEYFKRLLRRAISEFYGDDVPDMQTFKNRRRKTFMEQLEQIVGAEELRKNIAVLVDVRGRKQGVCTTLQNNQSAKRAELDAIHLQQMAELKARQQREVTELIAHYEPALLEAREAFNAADKDVARAKRASYFAGLNAEDDGRSYYGEKTVDDAVKERVDAFIETNLGNDEEGQAVKIRVHQEEIISDMAYIAEKVPDLRSIVLSFIRSGKLPPITIEAWGIEDGKDIYVTE